MSNDQKILYQTCRAIIEGKGSASLELCSVGPLCHARWLTLAIRINLLYMSTEKPSDELARLAWFVCNVYALLWFFVKKNWRAYQGPEIAYMAMKLVNGLSVDEKRIMSPVFERGFLYWMHPEQLILGCLASSDADVRAQAVARILKIRSDASLPPKPTVGKKRKRKPAPKVRIIELPDPIYEATHFTKMINWSKSQMTEAPLLRNMSVDEIKAFQDTPFTCAIPNNSQFVERNIQLIAKNGTRSTSHEIRQGTALATLASRERRARKTTKTAFSV